MAREDEGEGVRIQASGLGCNARCRRGTGISISGKVSLGNIGQQDGRKQVRTHRAYVLEDREGLRGDMGLRLDFKWPLARGEGCEGTEAVRIRGTR